MLIHTGKLVVTETGAAPVSWGELFRNKTTWFMMGSAWNSENKPR